MSGCTMSGCTMSGCTMSGSLRRYGMTASP
ncbi:hypothetical protein [Microtetraspora glauca]|uniref:Uncharacterized protein n=1 Tax=Microtetraspora glauca TaxID=1996 RepID=A0ABV3G9A9_MICGL